MQTSQCLFYRFLQERKEGLEAFKTSCRRRRRRRMRRRRRRMMMRRWKWNGRGGIRRICRIAWWWRRTKWSNFPWSFLPLVSFPCSFYFTVFSAKKKLNNHIVEIHHNPTL